MTHRPFRYFLFLVVLGNAQAQLPQRQAEIMQEVARVGGKIDKAIHQEFWEIASFDSTESKALSSWIPAMISLAQKQQTELWKSALLSRQAKRLIETPEYLEATAAYLRYAYEESPYAKDSDQYKVAIASFEHAASNARKNSNALLLAASEQRDAVAQNGMVMPTNPETIRTIIDNLESAFQRLSKLASPIWIDGSIPAYSAERNLEALISMSKMGNAEAQLRLGMLYFDGLGVTKNEVEALKWIRLSADQGNPDAQYHLGALQIIGLGTTKSETEGSVRMMLSAEDGNHRAQFLLGSMYGMGLGVPQDHTEAAKWFRLSAEQGNSDAQFSLGAAYSAGRGVPKDIVHSYLWYSLSSSQGNKRASDSRSRIEDKMTRAQIEQAQRLSRELTARKDQKWDLPSVTRD